MYTNQESNTKLKRTCEKPFTQASVLTIRPPGRYTGTKLMKYHRLGGFTCIQFLFWESQCGGELGQLVNDDDPYRLSDVIRQAAVCTGALWFCGFAGQNHR